MFCSVMLFVVLLFVLSIVLVCCVSMLCVHLCLCVFSCLCVLTVNECVCRLLMFYCYTSDQTPKEIKLGRVLGYVYLAFFLASLAVPAGLGLCLFLLVFLCFGCFVLCLLVVCLLFVCYAFVCLLLCFCVRCVWVCALVLISFVRAVYFDVLHSEPGFWVGRVIGILAVISNVIQWTPQLYTTYRAKVCLLFVLCQFWLWVVFFFCSMLLCCCFCVRRLLFRC